MHKFLTFILLWRTKFYFLYQQTSSDIPNKHKTLRGTSDKLADLKSAAQAPVLHCVVNAMKLTAQMWTSWWTIFTQAQAHSVFETYSPVCSPSSDTAYWTTDLMAEDPNQTLLELLDKYLNWFWTLRTFELFSIAQH